MKVPRVLAQRSVASRKLAALLLALAVATAIFVPTVIGYTSFDKIKDAEMTVQDVAIEGEESLAVTVTFENPTRSKVVIKSMETHVRVDGQLVNDFANTEFPETTVPAGESRTFTVRTPIGEGDRQTARQGIENESLVVFAKVDVRINDEVRTVTFQWQGVAA